MSLTFPYITGGTVSVVPGSTALTAEGTAFHTNAVLAGDVIFIVGENTHPVPIAEDATDNAALVLGLAWAGAELEDAPYFIMRAVDAERVMGAAREMIAISQGKFTEFEGVVDEATATVIAARDAAIAAKVIAEEAKETAELAAGGSTAALTAAEAAATAAAASEMASASSETNSAAYETAAETAATISLGAQGAAETAQSGAEAARDDAVAAKTAAELAETNAEAAQALSEGARDDALTAQTAAEAAKDAAETAETNAVTAQVAAELARDGSMDAQTAAETAQALTESARDAALAGWDQFDDKYLGAKSSDPSLDNDGNALIDGAVYWNTTTKEWRTFDASTTTWFALSGAGNASTIPTVPAGGLSSTNVQDALNELDTEKASAHNPVFTGTATGLNKAMVGLSNVDNTSDLSKPISTATQTALDAKANASALTSHTGNTSNPHSVTKAQVGLGNVDNTSDLGKPISTATQTALNGKQAAAGSTGTGNFVRESGPTIYNSVLGGTTYSPDFRLGAFSGSGATQGTTIDTATYSHSGVGTGQEYILAGYNANGLRGFLYTNGNNFGYTNLSDKEYKFDDGLVDPELAVQVLRLFKVHNFRWRLTNDAAIGMFAQDLHLIYPDAVVVGGWVEKSRLDEKLDPETGVVIMEMLDGELRPVIEMLEFLEYIPWSIDYVKLLPVLIVGMQAMLTRLDTHEARLATLEAATWALSNPTHSGPRQLG